MKHLLILTAMLIASFSAAMADDTPVIITTGDKYQGVLPSVGIDLFVTPEERYIHPAFCRETDIGTAVGSGDLLATNFPPKTPKRARFHLFSDPRIRDIRFFLKRRF